MSQNILIGFASILMLLGVFFVFRSFASSNKKYDRKKLICIGGMGVTLALIGGLVLVYFYYSLQPVPERILHEHLEEGYSERLLDISLQSKRHNKSLTIASDQI